METKQIDKSTTFTTGTVAEAPAIGKAFWANVVKLTPRTPTGKPAQHGPLHNFLSGVKS